MVTNNHIFHSSFQIYFIKNITVFYTIFQRYKKADGKRKVLFYRKKQKTN